MNNHPVLVTLALLFLAAVTLLLLPGCAVNGRPMRFAPQGASGPTPKAKSWYIEGKATNGAAVSCSFVEFDERGDFLDFAQHTNCQAKLRELTNSARVLLVMYCHGWKNSSQSGDVAEFNAFLARLAESEEVQRHGFRVHGVYLGWRGNAFEPYVDRGGDSYKGPLKFLARRSGSRFQSRGVLDRGDSRDTELLETQTGCRTSRVRFADGPGDICLRLTVKDYGKKPENRVCVMGHSFGALMLEKSLGQAMTGALTMEWWETSPANPGLPFDLVLFVNSAAPSIYAKEMRDFLEAHRRALGIDHDPTQDAPVIVSVTSTADWATGIIHPIGNLFAPLSPSLKRRYTSGIFVDPHKQGFPEHKGIRQSDFYTRTPGHQPYLINHWIVKEPTAKLPADPTPAAVFTANLATNSPQWNVFFTSKGKYPPAAWKITKEPQGKPCTMDGLVPAMAQSDYWIVSCGKELSGGHNDVWSTTTMEMYAGISRAAEILRKPARH